MQVAKLMNWVGVVYASSQTHAVSWSSSRSGRAVVLRPYSDDLWARTCCRRSRPIRTSWCRRTFADTAGRGRCAAACDRYRVLYRSSPRPCRTYELVGENEETTFQKRLVGNCFFTISSECLPNYVLPNTLELIFFEKIWVCSANNNLWFSITMIFLLQ